MVAEAGDLTSLRETPQSPVPKEAGAFPFGLTPYGRMPRGTIPRGRNCLTAEVPLPQFEKARDLAPASRRGFSCARHATGRFGTKFTSENWNGSAVIGTTLSIHCAFNSAPLSGAFFFVSRFRAPLLWEHDAYM